MRASEYRKEPGRNLSGKWGKAAIITLVYVIACVLLSLLDVVPLTGPILLQIIIIPIAYGIIATMIMLRKNEKVNVITFIDKGFTNFVRIWKVMLRILVKLLPMTIIYIIFVWLLVMSIIFWSIEMATLNYQEPMLLIFTVISAIGMLVSFIWLLAKSYLYAPTYYLTHENPEMTSKEIILKSETMMRGNRWRYFCLNISFIGWAILSVFTAGIGLLWLIPYMEFAEIEFFEKLKK